VNIVLQRLREQRAEQLAAIDSVLSQVGEERDLVDAERSLLEATRQRIAELDAQIKPLEEIERLRAATGDALPALPPARPNTVPAEPRRADALDRGYQYRSVGEFITDLVLASGYPQARQAGVPPVPDREAVARLQSRAVADQTTTGLPGILPQPIVGAVVSLIDPLRPLITSLGGARALANIPGTSFTRPKVATHTQVGVQTAEKTQLPSRAMVINQVPFTKQTYGGTVDVSRQSIDWTSPAAWDIIVRDLAEQYALATETAAAAAFKAAATATAVPIGTASQAITLAEWATGLYTMAMHSYQGGQRMPDRIWCSLDVWAALGSLVDTSRVVLPVDTTREMGAPGTSQLGMFAGDLFGLPRIVVPTFAAGTLIVGPSSLFEVYEEVIGLLSTVEPSLLGVQVAYGGYVAWGSLAGGAFVPATIAGTLPTAAELDADGEPADSASTSSSSSSSSKKS